MPGGKKKYPHTLADEELLALVGRTAAECLTHKLRYYVDLESGDVYSGKTSRKLHYNYSQEPKGGEWVQSGGSREKRPFVTLYFINRKRNISVSRLIWIIGAQRPIPKDFEIHHVDDDAAHNWYDNLLCTFSDDHKKIHAVRDRRADLTPF